MTVPHLKARLAIDCRDKLGEGPAWDGAGQRLIWADHQSGIVHEAKIGPAGDWRESRRWELGRPLAANIPRAKGGLLVIGGTDIFMLAENGDASPFARIEVDSERTRINDAKCDPQGRLWAGTLTSDFTPGGAALYRVDPDGAVTVALRELTLANGLDWSPDGSTFYFIDSLTRCVDAFTFDGAHGTISNRRTVVRLDNGVPNGMCVDREGRLWVAATGAGQVQCFTPAGALVAVVEIATPGATSCAFGGADGGELCITSRSGRMPDVALTIGLTPEMIENNALEAGGLFVCRPGATGAPATPFAG